MNYANFLFGQNPKSGELLRFDQLMSVVTGAPFSAAPHRAAVKKPFLLAEGAEALNDLMGMGRRWHVNARGGLIHLSDAENSIKASGSTLMQAVVSIKKPAESEWVKPTQYGPVMDSQIGYYCFSKMARSGVRFAFDSYHSLFAMYHGWCGYPEPLPPAPVDYLTALVRRHDVEIKLKGLDYEVTAVGCTHTGHDLGSAIATLCHRLKVPDAIGEDGVNVQLAQESAYRLLQIAAWSCPVLFLGYNSRTKQFSFNDQKGASLYGLIYE